MPYAMECDICKRTVSSDTQVCPGCGGNPQGNSFIQTNGPGGRQKDPPQSNLFIFGFAVVVAIFTAATVKGEYIGWKGEDIGVAGRIGIGVLAFLGALVFGVIYRWFQSVL